MHKLHQLKENLKKELETWVSQDQYDLKALQAIDATSSALKNVCKVMDMEKAEQGADTYSRRYMDMGEDYSRARDSRGRFMDSGNGYARSYHDGYGYSQEVEALKRKLSELEQNIQR